MTPEQFVYWLQGYVEISGGKQPYMREWEVIQDHLKLVMEKKTPQRFNLPVNPTLPDRKFTTLGYPIFTPPTIC